MRRESSPPRSARPPASAASKGTELLAAYVDGVGELTPSERRRVELLLADETGAREDEAATRDLIGKLRELPRQSEPDWITLERSIQEAVGDEVPRPFWRKWRFAVPVLALAGATAIAVFALRGTSEDSVPAPIVIETPTPERAPADETMAVYLDGTDLELAIETAELADDRLDEMTFAGLDSFEPEENLLGNDLGWVDDLDEADLQRLEGWLERKKVKGT
jgi:hypothetical protein